MKHKSNIIIYIFIFLVLVYGLRSLFGNNVQVETLRRGTMEDMVNTKGILIKYETVLGSDFPGVFDPLVQEGARVGVGQELAAVYSGSVDPALRTRLEQVKKKITQIEENQSNLYAFGGDVSRIEQAISEETSALVDASQSGNLDAVSDIRLNLEALSEKKAQLAGGNAAVSTLDELKRQKADLESQIGAAQNRIYANASGIFSTAVDGFESLITPYNMTELTPAKLDEILAKEHSAETKTETAACKIVDNFRYFVALSVPVDKLTGLRAGSSASLRLYDLTADLISGTILFISPEEDGRSTVILECDRFVDSLLKRRFVNVDFVKKRYQGYRINVKCLRTKDGVKGVYVRRDDVLRFIPVTILYNSQDIAIIDSADGNRPLKLYDEVVVRAGSYEEGKLLR